MAFPAKQLLSTRATLVGALAVGVSVGALAAPQVSVTNYGTTADGRAVHAYTLTNDHSVSAKILDYGGIIAELNAPDRRGQVKKKRTIYTVIRMEPSHCFVIVLPS